MKETLPFADGVEGRVWVWNYTGYQHYMHRHDELEVNICTRGSASYLVGDRRYELRRGTQIWLYPDDDHLLLDQSTDYQMWILVFKPELVKRNCTTPETRTLLSRRPPANFCKPLAEHQTARIAALCEEVAACKDDIPRSNAGSAYLLLAMWAAHNADERITPSFDIHPAVEKAARLIHDESQPMGIEELGRRSGLSPSRLSRLFKEQTGVSLVDYRNKQRMQRFMHLYQQGRRKSMMAAALEAGFGSYPQFHRVFKALMKCGPAEYRRKIGAKQ